MESGTLKGYLAASSARHGHLCPRQALGVRIALAGAAALGMPVPRTDKRLLVILEMDGCFADGILVVTGISVGKRTLRIEDYGKVAATFFDGRSQKAGRVAPQPDARARADQLLPEEHRHYFAQLNAYEFKNAEDLLVIQNVVLRRSFRSTVSRPGIRANCSRCGVEILNGREITRIGEALCQACLFRISGKRSLSQITTFDFVLLLVITLVGLDILISLFKQKSPGFGKLVDSVPVILVENGKPLKERMEKERVDTKNRALRGQLCDL